MQLWSVKKGLVFRIRFTVTCSAEPEPQIFIDGIAIELVSTVLGHARTDTTKSYYAKPSVEQLRDAMESVPTPVSDEAPMWEDNEDEMARLCGLR